MRADRRRVGPGGLIGFIALLLSVYSFAACGSSAPERNPAEGEAVLETFYATVAEINDLVIQVDAETDEYVALGDLAEAQLASGDILGVADTLREASGISLRSAAMTRSQINIVDGALERCMPKELTELLELHRQEARIMVGVFEAEATRDRLMAEALEAGPGNATVEKLAVEAQEADIERVRLLGEAEEIESRRLGRERTIFAIGVTPTTCD
jgi:hypothetical protein